MASYPIAKIDLAALKHNLLRVKQQSSSRIMSVVKANGYGHGAVEIAHALNDSDAFAVARLSEAVQLRDAGITHPIVILDGVNSTADLQTAADYSLSLVFHHESQIELILSTVLTKPLDFCWIMAETGMHRLGLTLDKFDNALQKLKSCDNIMGQVGLMSHLANADSINDARNQQQLDLFQQFMSKAESATSMANSAAVLSLADSHGDWLRPGLMLYGISPFEDKTAQDLGLKPVMELSSIITSIQMLEEGDAVGYGGEWIAQKPTQIAIVSIGYGDGYSRQLSDIGVVLIKEKLASILGRVSMDMIAVDLSNVDDVIVGEKVILWGHPLLSVESVAEKAKTIPYELVCQISERVRREYHHGKA